MTENAKSEIFSLLGGKKRAENARFDERELHTPESEFFPSKKEAPRLPQFPDSSPPSSSEKTAFLSDEKPNEREIRATFIIKEAYSNAMRDLAWFDRKKIKDVLNEALESYLVLNNEKLENIKKLKKAE